MCHLVFHDAIRNIAAHFVEDGRPSPQRCEQRQQQQQQQQQLELIATLQKAYSLSTQTYRKAVYVKELCCLQLYHHNACHKTPFPLLSLSDSQMVEVRNGTVQVTKAMAWVFCGNALSVGVVCRLE